MNGVLIEVWSDYVCPFCYLAEPTLQQLEREFGPSVQVSWRAFELRPDPVPTLDPKGDYLRDIWARAVYPMARDRGMTLRLPPVQPRSRLAHEAMVFARQHGLAAELNHALFQAFFEHGQDIGQRDLLTRLGREVGLPETELRQALESGAHRPVVLAEEALAQNLGISGVPAMTLRRAGQPLAEAFLVEGAQPYGTLQNIVSQLATHPA